MLGQNTIEEMGLVSRNVSAIKLNPEILRHNFDGIGKIKAHPYKIKLKENYIPKTASCRLIPFRLKGKVKIGLDKLEKQDIIEKVHEPTEFFHVIVVVLKPDGSIRIQIDPRSLNDSVMRPHYKMATVTCHQGWIDRSGFRDPR